jgi:hypothetical protein
MVVHLTLPAPAVFCPKFVVSDWAGQALSLFDCRRTRQELFSVSVTTHQQRHGTVAHITVDACQLLGCPAPNYCQFVLQWTPITVDTLLQGACLMIST